MGEALACVGPVAAFPVAGPVDIVTERTGALSEQIERAIDAALYCNRKDCAAHGASFSWDAATHQFLARLVTCEAGYGANLIPLSAFGFTSGARWKERGVGEGEV